MTFSQLKKNCSIIKPTAIIKVSLLLVINSTTVLSLQTQHEDASESEAEMSELSMNFGEMDIVDPKDSSYVTPSTSSSSTTGSATTSSQGDGPTGWAAKKWLVNESKLMELFQRCNQCGCVISEKNVTSRGSQIKIDWSCLNGHSDKWASCPDVRGMAENNLLFCTATIFTGATYTSIAEWVELMNVEIPKPTQFYSIQSTYLIPVIQYAYKDQQDKILERLRGIGKCGECGFMW